MRDLNTLTAYWHNDTPHQAEPHPTEGFVIVMDPQRIFKRGNSFDRQDMAVSLWRVDGVKTGKDEHGMA